MSGPIIKDKLFFFANAENRKESYPSRFYAGYDEKGFSTDMAQKIADKYEEYTGIRESFGSRDVDQRAFNFLGRIDWNIDRNNKLASVISIITHTMTFSARQARPTSLTGVVTG